MKRIIRFFVVCLALSAFQTGVVFGAETTKTQSKRNSATTVSTTKTSSRSSASKKQQTSESKQEKEQARTTKISRSPQTAVKSRATATTAVRNQVVKQRTNTQKKQPKKVSTVSRTAASSHVVNESKKTTSARSTVNSSAISRATRTQAILNDEKIANIKAKNYAQCKTVFYECMDEFCANKDTNLRRCSCSARIHEFDNIKKQLAKAEDKMLDYNQRLLTVSLNKEDAAAINKATEGELGFNTKDKTESEKLLQKISSTLNSSSDSKFNNEMSSISLDLDMDSAWDSVDSTSGIATTSKNGVDLYNAATPVCIEMAKEICSDSELEIVQGNYKLAIQQDCNTVSKSYATQYNQALSKIHESGALLDMARLNTYQQQNSDDVLTCRKKILAQLNDESVCGENLYKCLDTTGQYINPATGEAFLSTNLYNLTTLLTAPKGKETWAGMKQNEKFVTFLNSKKVYLETATEQCKTMSDVIWKDFLNDALGKIKLAQNSKLEEIRQSCTTLVAECKNNMSDNLKDFDARALSTFSVLADTTVNALCKDVQTACTELMASSGGGDDFWQSGMQGIALDTNFDKIIETCTTIGKDCIIQQCNGTSGNFALCGKSSDQPRMAILTRQACWNEIKNCVKQGIIEDTDIDRFNLTRTYKALSTSTENDQYNYCDAIENDSIDCKITEYIWGNCEYKEDTDLVTEAFMNQITNNSGTKKTANHILTPVSGETLLSWFAYNTGTTSSYNSCLASSCPVNYKLASNNTCVRLWTLPDNAHVYPSDENIETEDQTTVVINQQIYNYCPGGIEYKDTWKNCCFQGDDTTIGNSKIQNVISSADSATYLSICVPYDGIAIYLTTFTCSDENDYYCRNGGGQLKLYCIIQETGNQGSVLDVANDNTLYCPGFFIMINSDGDYFVPQYQNYTPSQSDSSVEMYYNYTNGAECIYTYNNGSVSFLPDSSHNGINCVQAGNSSSNNLIHMSNAEFMVRYKTNGYNGN